MQWKHTRPPRYGDKRFIKHFCLYPVADDKSERTYWLETVYLYQKYYSRYNSGWETIRVYTPKVYEDALKLQKEQNNDKTS